MGSKKFLILFSLFAILFSCTLFADDGFMPKWKLGDSWVIEAKYINLKDQGTTWLPPIRWRFEVKAQKAFNNEPCWVLHITPESRPDLKVQSILCLSQKDLRPIRVVDIFPLRGEAKSKTKNFEGARISPLFSDDSMIPYDFPMFPLNAAVEGVGSAVVAGEKASKVDEITFVEDVTQNWAPTTDGFKVVLQDGGGKGQITQTWKEGSPWATEMKSYSVVYTLVK
ncbi:MAG: hypothetical protein HQM08_11785 [Candidatus Riflebacteria bacterium]|nr:hypothetical protein [Candidatus Riflebacteria bacterium]